MDVSHPALTAELNSRQTDYAIGKLSKLDPVQSHFVIRVHSLQINSGKSFWGASGVKMKNTAKYLSDHIHLYLMSIIQILIYIVYPKSIFTQTVLETCQLPAGIMGYSLNLICLNSFGWLKLVCPLTVTVARILHLIGRGKKAESSELISVI